jgi:hypothetical protein
MPQKIKDKNKRTPNFLEGRDQENLSLRPAQAKS